MCINYTNEKLQQFFNQFIFKLEQEEYEKEGISWSKVSFNDNILCLELIEGKMGILSLLDEECKMPKGSDDSLLSKMHDSLSGNEYYIRPRTACGLFGVTHYAGDVMYDIKCFLDKNRNSIAEEIIELFHDSEVFNEC